MIHSTPGVLWSSLSRGSGLSYPDFINVGAVFPNISRMMR